MDGGGAEFVTASDREGEAVSAQVRPIGMHDDARGGIVGVRVHGVVLHLSSAVFWREHLVVILVLNHEIHDLACARPNHTQPRVTQRSRDGVDVRVPDTAHHLHGFVHNLPGRLCGETLGLAHNTPLVWVALVYGTRRHQAQPSSRIQLGDTVRHLEAHALIPADLLTESPAFRRVAHGYIQRTPNAQTTRRGSEPLRDHHLMEAQRSTVKLAH